MKENNIYVLYFPGGVSSAMPTLGNGEGCKDKFDFFIDVDFIDLDVYQTEDWVGQSGLETLSCLDIGGGEYVASIENNDWSTYSITVDKKAVYDLTFRVANVLNGGFVIISREDSVLTTVPVKASNTNDEWTTTIASEITLEEGAQELKFTFKGSAGTIFYLNWFNFEYNRDEQTVILNDESSIFLKCYPNPMGNALWIKGENLEQIELVTMQGLTVLKTNNIKDPVKVSHLKSGIYFVRVINKMGEVAIEKILKQ